MNRVKNNRRMHTTATTILNYPFGSECFSLYKYFISWFDKVSVSSSVPNYGSDMWLLFIDISPLIYYFN